MYNQTMKPLVVFTYAPAGLGHIRVADALISGIPTDVPYVEFSPADSTTEVTHRFTSLNVPARHAMEFFQRGQAEELFSKVYSRYLKTHPDGIPEQFISLIKSQNFKPEKIVIVATHFGLAYQLGAIKSQLEKQLGAQINLVVQVTDDSPQTIWYVDLADLIVAPSHKTKGVLQDFAIRNKLRKVPIEVAPYPVDLTFAKKLPPEKIIERKNQYDPTRLSPINVAIPVSGAAVGMEFFLHLIGHLHTLSPRFHFDIVCRKAPFTQQFLQRIGLRDHVTLHVSTQYRSVVELYERLYKNRVIAMEITKPSEQSFKALLQNNSVGGSLLLLAEPVGRQEWDNVDFLHRNNFLSADPGNYINDQINKPNNLRGLILPNGSKASADLIWDGVKSGKFLKAFNNFTPKQPSDELGDDGVTKFWEIVFRFCQSV